MKMPRVSGDARLFADPARPAPSAVSGPMSATHALGRRRRALLCSSALIGLFAILPGVNPAQAQVTIDGGQTVTVPSVAQPSPWNIGADLYVGLSGPGALNIVSGGKVNGSNGFIGVSVGSNGKLVVDGFGSEWTGTGGLYTGVSGAGMLDVINGGSVFSNGTSIIGDHAGSSGVLTVDGAQSIWKIGGNLIVGNSGAGTMNIRNGGAVSNSFGTVGAGAGSNGVVTVDGVGSIWTNDNSLYVGGLGTGSLNITNGGNVFSSDGGVISSSGASGAVTVDGVGSKWVISNNFNAGGNGTSTLTIKNGGVVSDAFGNIGGVTASNGAVMVDGAGSTWTNSSDLYVGSNGSGTLAISNGGSVSSVNGSVGGITGAGSSSPDSKGLATVDGTGSTWTNTGGLSVGHDGSGKLIVSNGGSVSSAYGEIGSHAGSGGFAEVDGDGSTWTNSGRLYVGLSGAGTLNVRHGGRISSVGGSIGNDAGSSGTVAVDGAGSTWTNTGRLDVGSGGTGTLSITNGGRVSNADGYIGHGAVTVDGAGSTWINSGSYFTVGDRLKITNGGSVVFNAVAMIDGSAGSSGTVTVDGAGSKWSSTTTGTLHVGDSGNGALAVSNGGSVSVAYSFIGGGPGATGTATVDGAGSTWTSTNYVNVGDRGTGTVTISNGGLVSTPNMYIGRAGGQGTLVFGGLQGGVVQAPGRLDTPSVNLDATGSLVFQHNDTAGYSFDAQIVGTGALKQVSGTTILTANSGLSANNGTFIGATSVSGGELRVNGSIDFSPVTVSGGTLGGIGTVGGTVVQSGGAVAPGDGGIGTLNVAGNITFEPGSIYRVKVNAAGQSDRIKITGGASIHGGAVDVLAGSGNYAPSTRYTILTGGRRGTFDSVSSNLIFLTPSLDYDARSVYLTMTRNNIDFAAIGRTPNQHAAGSGAESLGYGTPVYNAVLNLSAPQARSAFDQLSGEIHTSASSVLIEESHFVRDAATNRVRSAFGAVGASRAPVMTYADTSESRSNAHAAFASLDTRTTAVIAAAPTTDRFALWGQGFGGWGNANSDGNAARLTHSTGGLLIGGDAPILDTWRLGMMAGYSRTDFNARDRASSGTSENYHLGLYGGTQWGNLGFRSGAAYTWHDISTSRSIAFPGFNDSLKGSYRAETAQVFGELGYGLRAGRLGLEPFVNLAYVNLSTDGFAERGGAAALVGKSTTTDATFTTLGVHASTSFDLGGINATARGTLGWRHAFGDVTPESILLFAAGSPFSIAGVPIAANAAVVDAGLDFAVSSNVALGLSYNGQFGSGVTDQSVRANFNIKF